MFYPTKTKQKIIVNLYPQKKSPEQKADVDAEILDRFANDKFWRVRIEVVDHPNVSEVTLPRLLEPKVSKRSVVHHASHAKLLERGVEFDEDGMPIT